MALSDKNILITPNIGAASDPKLVFSGADASTTAQNITLTAYPTNGGTLSFDGSAGQLFSVTNSMSGTIFSVNDVSGIPSIEVIDTGLVKIAQYSGNLLLGSGTDTGLAKLQVTGSLSVTGNMLYPTNSKSVYGPNTSWSSYLHVGGDGINGITRTSTIASVVTTNGNLHLDSGSDKAMYLNFYSGNGGVQFGNGALGITATVSAGGVFNGTNVTVNGSQTLHAGNYTSYSPSLTGGSASGTWGISVTGNATTATYATSASRIYSTDTSYTYGSSAPYYGYLTYIGSTDRWRFQVSPGTPAGVEVAYADTAGSVTGLTVNSSAVSINPDNVTQNQIGYNTSVSLFGQTDGGLYSSAHTASWIHQIYGDFRTGQIAVRGKNSGTWQGWRVVLDASNYNSYSPTLTGGNASGTWGINVTGSAGSAPANGGTATALNSSNYIARSGSSGSTSANFQATPAGTYRYQGDDNGLSDQPAGGGWWHYEHMRHSNGSNYWGTTIAWGWEDAANRLAVRNVSANSYQAWVYYLNSSNYNSYSPTLTGGNASGTWSITADSANYVNSQQSRLDGGNYQIGWLDSTAKTQIYGTAACYINPSTGSIVATHFKGSGNVGGTGEAIHCPSGIYSQGTNWLYGQIITNGNNIDAGTGTVTAATFSGNATSASTLTGTTNNLGYSLSGQDVGYGGHGGPQIQSQGTGASMMSFHRPGYYAINFGLGSDNQLRTGGWSRSGSFVILDSGNYSSYSPTLTGGGASGTWGINVTGTAGSTGILTGSAHTNGSDGWFRSAGAAGLYCETYAVGWYATQAGRIDTYNNASIYTAGNVTAYSDERVKTNWRCFNTNFIEKLSKVKSGTYDRTDAEMTQVGVSAQSLREVIPYAVIEDVEGKLSVAYGNAALVSAVELAKRIIEQDARIARLETLVSKLIEG